MASRFAAMAMGRPILLLIPLLAACEGGEVEGTAERGTRMPVQTAELTGLYEGPGEGERRTRMCMIRDAAGIISFGIVAWSPDGGACSGAGEVVRLQENILRFVMTGDEECVIEARAAGTQVAFPMMLPESCAYNCGPGATLEGETFEKTGGTAEDAMLATDLVGDPLCG